MATLQKIRNHGVLLLVIVGVAMLAFILGDFLNSGSSFFNRFKAAVIDGEEITPQEYSNAVEQAKGALEMDFQFYQGAQFQFSEDTVSMIRQQTWQTLVLQTMLAKETEEIGMYVTDDEFEQMCYGVNPSPIIANRPFFLENGQYSPAQLRQFTQFINQDIDEVSPEMAQQVNQINQLRSYWQYWEQYARLTRLQEKYSTLMQQLFVPNKLEAKYAFQAAQDRVDVDYVVYAYDSLKNDIQVGDRDIKKLYNSRKKYYKCTPFRTIVYVTFDKNPQEKDYSDVESLLASKAEEFQTTDNVALLINPISDVRYTGQDYSETTVPEIYKEFAFGEGVAQGNVSPIMKDGDTYSMARIMKCGYQTPDSVKITVLARDTTEKDQPAQWVEMAMLEKDMRDSIMAKNMGDTIVFGAQDDESRILFTLDSVRSVTPKVQIAILQKKVTPSQATRDQIRNKANQFIINNSTSEAFRAAAFQEGLNPMQANLGAADDMVNRMKSTRSIVKWAYEVEEEETPSDVFDCGNQFVVAIVTDINDEDYISMESLRKDLTAELVNNKKAELIIAKMAEAKDLAAAAKIANSSVQTATNISLNSYGIGGQQEPSVLGTALKQEVNKLGAPVKGEEGVYMMVVKNRTTGEDKMDVTREKQNLMWNYYRAAQNSINYLIQEAKIEDLRGTYMND